MKSSSVSKMYHQEKRLGARIHIAGKKGSRKLLWDGQRAYLNSRYAKFVASFEAICEGRKKATLKDKKEALELADKINVWEACNEKVGLDPQPKANTQGFRWFLDFKVENKARQILVRNALKYRSKTSPEQFALIGGRDKAIDAVGDYYKQGNQFILELDVYHAFRSFDVVGVSKFLSLPKEVSLNVLSGINLNIFLRKSYRKTIHYSQSKSSGLTPIEEFNEFESDWEPARQGLAEGACVSPLVCEMLLSWVVDRLPKYKGELVNYVDNFLFMAKSEDDIQELELELRLLLRQHPAGPLKVKTPMPVVKPGQRFEFLGYTLVPDGELLSVNWNDRVEKKVRGQRKRTYHILGSKIPIEDKKKAVVDLFDQQKSIYSGFSRWTEGNAQLRTKMQRVVKRAVEKGVSYDQLPKRLRSVVGSAF